MLVLLLACAPDAVDLVSTPTGTEPRPPVTTTITTTTTSSPTSTTSTTTSTDPCENTCGDLWWEGAWHACEDCRQGAELDDAMEPVDHVLDRLATESPMADIVDIDADAIRTHAESALRREPDLERGQTAAINRAVQGYRNGHTGIYRYGGCAENDGVDPWSSPRGGCLEPHDDGFVVTRGSVALELLPGDRVVGYNGFDGTALIDHVADGPLCAYGSSDADVRHNLAAHALLGTLREGDVIEVEHLDGTLVSVEVGAPTQAEWCGPDTSDWISSYVRDDGIAVLRISRWILYPGDPNYISLYEVEDWDEYKEAMLSTAKEHFDAVTPGSKGLIFDVRSNQGGFTLTGLAIAGGMPGLEPGPATSCRGRVPGSDPIRYYPYTLDYELVDEPRFAYDGPVAALFDGSSVSASDYFAYVLRERTDVRLFGRPTSGSFGGSGPGQPIAGATDYYLGIDATRCDDLDGMALETRTVQPHERVDPQPDDVAAGIDSVMEAAAAWIDAEG